MPKAQMARVYLGFLYHEACLGVLLLPLGQDSSLSQSYLLQYVTGAHLKQWTKVPCLRKFNFKLPLLEGSYISWG